MRTATIERNTKETQISLTLDLDGEGRSKIESPLFFMNHMLEKLMITILLRTLVSVWAKLF